MNIAARLRARRAAARTRREIGKAIDNAATASMRNELMQISQRQLSNLR